MSSRSAFEEKRGKERDVVTPGKPSKKRKERKKERERKRERGGREYRKRVKSERSREAERARESAKEERARGGEVREERKILFEEKEDIELETRKTERNHKSARGRCPPMSPPQPCRSRA